MKKSKLFLVFIIIGIVGSVSAVEEVDCEEEVCVTEVPPPPSPEDSLDDYFESQLLDDIVEDLNKVFNEARLLVPDIENPPVVG